MKKILLILAIFCSSTQLFPGSFVDSSDYYIGSDSLGATNEDPLFNKVKTEFSTELQNAQLTNVQMAQLNRAFHELKEQKTEFPDLDFEFPDLVGQPESLFELIAKQYQQFNAHAYWELVDFAIEQTQ